MEPKAATVERGLPVIVPDTAITPMQLVQMAVQQGADIDKLGKLLDLQMRWEADQARKAFHIAFAAFKSETIKIVKQTGITDGPLKGKKYADLSTAVEAATPFLSKHGLSASWKITKEERDWLEVGCVLTHVQGHSENVFFGGPPDTGGAKNPMQARASTLNYLERYTFLAVTGLAAQGADTDGRELHTMPESMRLDFVAAIEALADMPAWDTLWKSIGAATTAYGDVKTHEELRSLMIAKKKALTTKGTK